MGAFFRVATVDSIEGQMIAGPLRGDECLNNTIKLGREWRKGVFGDDDDGEAIFRVRVTNVLQLIPIRHPPSFILSQKQS